MWWDSSHLSKVDFSQDLNINALGNALGAVSFSIYDSVRMRVLKLPPPPPFQPCQVHVYDKPTFSRMNMTDPIFLVRYMYMNSPFSFHNCLNAHIFAQILN